MKRELLVFFLIRNYRWGRGKTINCCSDIDDDSDYDDYDVSGGGNGDDGGGDDDDDEGDGDNDYYDDVHTHDCSYLK